ncbi:MAG: glycosyltransferase family 9 protein [Planctomycetes bacterium]|nr:glycosyltransferase family 9 protein [Planctomycetota bacterium]
MAHRSDPLEKLHPFDLVVAFWRDAEGVLAGNLGRLCPGKIIVRDPVPPVAPKCHAVDHLCGVLAEIGIEEYDPTPKLFSTEQDLAQADAFLAEKALDPAQTIAIHPGSGGRTKNWPTERFGEIIERIESETDCRVLLTGGPADEEAMAEIGGSHPTAENLPLPLLAAILSRCRTYLGNDSGITHIAAAVGAPTVVIFGPTDPDVWGPRGEHVTILRGQAPCAPCSREERMACPDRKCLASVSVDAVWKRMGM